MVVRIKILVLRYNCYGWITLREHAEEYGKGINQPIEHGVFLCIEARSSEHLNTSVCGLDVSVALVISVF